MILIKIYWIIYLYHVRSKQEASKGFYKEIIFLHIGLGTWTIIFCYSLRGDCIKQSTIVEIF